MKIDCVVKFIQNAISNISLLVQNRILQVLPLLNLKFRIVVIWQIFVDSIRGTSIKCCHAALQYFIPTSSTGRV